MTHHNPLDPEALSRASLERASKAIGADDFARYCFSVAGLRESDPDQEEYFEALALAGPDLEALRDELATIEDPEWPGWVELQIEWLTPCVEYWRNTMA